VTAGFFRFSPSALLLFSEKAEKAEKLKKKTTEKTITKSVED